MSVGARKYPYAVRSGSMIKTSLVCKHICSLTHFLLMAVTLIIGLVSCNSRSYECTDSLGCIEVNADEPIRIAYLLTLSGTTQSLGQDALGGIELAIDGYQGKIFGRTIELSGEKPDCEPEEMLTAATRISLQPNVVGVIGPFCSQSYNSTYNVLVNAGQVMIGLPPLPVLEPFGGPTSAPGLFRLTIDLATHGNTIAQFAYSQLGVRQAAIIMDGSQSSAGSTSAMELQQAFANAFQQLGGRITVIGEIPPDRIDVQNILNDLVKEPPEVIYLPVFEGAGSDILSRLSSQPELKDSVFLGDIDFLTKGLILSSESILADRVYLVGPDLNYPDYRKFMEQWLLMFNKPPQSVYPIYAYDSTHILLAAIADLAELDKNGNMFIGRQALRQKIADTQDFEGLSGNISCHQSNECNLSQTFVIYYIPQTQGDGWQWPPLIVWKPNGQ